MEQNSILAAIDDQIRKLQQARALLADFPAGPGRPKGSTVANKRGTMSAEGRARIAAAQKKRWAALKK